MLGEYGNSDFIVICRKLFRQLIVKKKKSFFLSWSTLYIFFLFNIVIFVVVLLFYSIETFIKLIKLVWYNLLKWRLFLPKCWTFWWCMASFPAETLLIIFPVNVIKQSLVLLETPAENCSPALDLHLFYYKIFLNNLYIKITSTVYLLHDNMQINLGKSFFFFLCVFKISLTFFSVFKI